MEEQIKVLGIAPYESMERQMRLVAEQFPEISLTAFTGNLEDGVDLAQHHLFRDYDVIISRGGTAELLRSRLQVPVTEIRISTLDVVRAMRLAKDITNRFAIIGYPSVAANAENARQILQCDMDIYAINKEEELEQVLRTIQDSGIHTLLCDTVSYQTALRLNMDVILITSGVESIRDAMKEALQISRSQQRLRRENHFLRSLLQNQFAKTVVLDHQGNVFFSTVKQLDPPLLEYLRDHCGRPASETARYLRKQIDSDIYSIRVDQESIANRHFTSFSFLKTKDTLPEVRRCIRYMNVDEAKRQYLNSIYGITNLLREDIEFIGGIVESDLPIVICGEQGTLKEEIANYCYITSAHKRYPMVSIDCFSLSDTVWEYLQSQTDSPLALENHTIFIRNIHALSENQFRKLLNLIGPIAAEKKSRFILSVECAADELTTATAGNIVAFLGGTLLRVKPLREQASCLPIAANLMISQLNISQAKQIMGLEEEALRLLARYSWPWNHFQFGRIMKEVVSMTQGQYIGRNDVGRTLANESAILNAKTEKKTAGVPLDLSRSLKEIEREIAGIVLEEEHGNRSKTAKRLGISRTTLWRLIDSEEE